MTNQQGAPDALTDFERRHAIRQGYEIAASDGYFEARPQIDSNDRRKVFQAGFERGWDRHAALVEAQQPATHVQNPAEIEHVAGDVSKNGAEVNTSQQPAPATQQAGWTNADADAARLALGLECLLMDTKDAAVVGKWWASANDALEMHRARLQEVQPTPTPQADSQPALPEITDEDRSFLHYDPNTDDIVEWVQHYASAAITADRAMRAKADSVLEDAARYRWLAASCRSTSEHWGGRWSIIIDGPAPKSHDSEDDFNAAVDAARKQGGAT